jgi:hypothetical protein
MLDIVKDEYREKIQNSYNEVMEIISDPNNYEAFYKWNTFTDEDIDIVVKAYQEIFRHLYLGDCYVTTLKRSSYCKDGYRDIHYFDVEGRIEWKYDFSYRDAVVFIKYPINKKEDPVRFSTSLSLKDEFINKIREFINLTFKGKNKQKVKTEHIVLTYENEFNVPIKTEIKNYLIKRVRDRKINSLLC